jgi:hypothetical protein
MHGLAIEHPSAPISRTGGVAHAPGKGGDGSPPALSNNRPRTGLAGKLAWSAAGFLIGAAFWHVIGFWSFVSYVVLGNPDSGAYLASSARIVSIAAADQAPARPTCITLALDRATGHTRPEPCEATALALPHVAASAREDLVLPLDRSAPTILPHSGAAPSARSMND